MRFQINTQQTILLVVLFIWTFTFSNERAFNNDIAKGVAIFNEAYDSWNETQFKKADSYFQKIKSKYTQNYEPFYWLAVVNFYLVTFYLFGFEKDYSKKTAEIHLKEAIAYAKKAIRLNPVDAESYALLGTMNGINITFKPMTAVMVGSSVSKNIKNAQELAPQNPRVLYLVGMSYYHTPGVLGGGFRKGLSYLQQAEVFFQAEQKKNLELHIPQWGFSTCLSFIGNIYLKKDMFSEAKQYYTKALDINSFDKQAKMGLVKIK